MFSEEPAEKSSKKIGEKTAAWSRCEYQVPGMYHIKNTFDNNKTNCRRGLLQKAATTRDRCVAPMLLRSCRDVRRPRHLPSAKFAAILHLIQMGPRKNKRVSERPTNIKENRHIITHFFIRGSTPAEYVTGI